MSCALFSNDDADSLAHRAGSDGLVFAPQRVIQLTFCYLSTDERLPGGMAVSASSHLISSHLISSHLISSHLISTKRKRWPRSAEQERTTQTWRHVHDKYNNWNSRSSLRCNNWKPRTCSSGADDPNARDFGSSDAGVDRNASAATLERLRTRVLGKARTLRRSDGALEGLVGGLSDIPWRNVWSALRFSSGHGGTGALH